MDEQDRYEDDASVIDTMAAVAKGVLTGMAVVMLAPALLTLLGFLAFFMLPAAIVGIPFMVPALFGTGAAEHKHEVEHRQIPALQPAPAH